MRIISYRRGAETRSGVVLPDQERFADLHDADPDLPADVKALLELGRPALEAVRRIDGPGIPLGDVELLAPVPRPGKILGVGLNYRDHAQESGSEVPDFPTVFAKFPTSATGPYSPIVLPKASTQVDYEAELGVVIGALARDVPEESALDVVAGYLACNDVSARDVQNRTSQWTLGKSFDTFAPMGPWLVTAEEIPDPQDLELSTRIGTDTLQESGTRHMIFSVRRLISLLSAIVPLEPGDVIATGTPAGVGASRTPPRLLRAGDVVEVEVGRIGTLRNPVVAA